jgi:predicted HTH transcriptional regulator
VLKEYIQNDALLSRFFEAFIFEDLPASERHPNKAYIERVKRSDIYIGLFGNEYGALTKKNISSTHEEFLAAAKNNRTRLIFIKGTKDSDRDPKMLALIKEAGKQVIRRRFATAAELISSVYASLVDYLETKELLRTGPFDAAVCRNAVINDLSAEKIRAFVRSARHERGFPLKEDTAIREILEHLNLLREDGKPTNAAILLFGKKPQRFLISSEIKCAHFHGTDVAKPIPSYQIYKGTAFELTDQALDFVLSKIDLAVGTRAKSVQAPRAYEIPPDVIREAIVNAVAHRDYTSNGSIQVMLFRDRLEVWNPGTLPPTLTLAKLRQPHRSVPGNPLIAEALYLTKYIERMGTGTRDMIRDCKKAGLREPKFSLTDGFMTTIYRKPGRALDEVSKESGFSAERLGATQGTKSALSQHQVMILRKCAKPVPLVALMKVAGRTDRTKFRNQFMKPLISKGFIDMTVPDKPNSRFQKYRLTKKGAVYLRMNSGTGALMGEGDGKTR